MYQCLKNSARKPEKIYNKAHKVGKYLLKIRDSFETFLKLILFAFTQEFQD